MARRLICMVYEALLLAAVELFAVALFLLASHNAHSALLDHARQACVFLVAAAYFMHFWVDSGHTLAMKTWRIKLIKPGHAYLPIRTAALRYLLAWGWFLPALIVCYVFKLNAKADVGMALLAGMALWAATALLDKDRQFLHDRLAGTRLVQLPKPDQV